VWRAHVGGDHVIEEKRPVAAPAAVRVGMHHPDDGAAEPAQAGAQAVDVRHDAAEGGVQRLEQFQSVAEFLGGDSKPM
jgi:hypothetical protein